MTVTCQQSSCDAVDKRPFAVTGDDSVVYGNLVLVNGGYFDDQLKGQALQGGKLTGWLWFQVTKTDKNLYLVDLTEGAPRFFSLFKTSSNGTKVRVVSNGTVNIRSCAGTNCSAIGRATNGDELIVLEDLGQWFHVRTIDGSVEGYISASVVQRE